MSVGQARARGLIIPLSTRIAWKRSPGSVLASSHVYDTAIIVTNCLLHELGGHCAVNSPAHGPDDATCWTADITNARDLLSNKFFLIERMSNMDFSNRWDINTIVQFCLHPQISSMK